MNYYHQKRLKINIQGVVQGVGFRPFIYRLASELTLTGWVNNSAQGVNIEVEGKTETLNTFLHRLEREKPPHSLIQNLQITWLEPLGYQDFTIRASVAGELTALISADMATCADCLQEIFNPNHRRYRYPFTNCTHCGPRYTIIEALPYDRPYTTMKTFSMCRECQQEYQNPLNRRFHAQPNACAKCGPKLEFWDQNEQLIDNSEDALIATVKAIRQGQIMAIKGLGGFHLVVDATNQKAVQRLRQRKQRLDKPFALMYPHLDLIKQHCQVSALEEKLLLSPIAPIVLLYRHNFKALSTAVAPNNPYLGVMLPYTPLHHLLLSELAFPVVATSGNLAGEPICIDEQEAQKRLATIADGFLVHNRPILRPVDDSIVRVMGGRTMILRRARGYAPLPIALNLGGENLPDSMLAVGAHLKNAIAILHKKQVFLSQYLGDLETPQSLNNFEKTITSLSKLYELKPKTVVCDGHPDYFSTQYAQNLDIPCVQVQHHHAHILSCMAENQLLGERVLGIAWDGTGYGLDGTIWGGEFFGVSTSGSIQRIAHLKPFLLPGGNLAIKEPRRVALGLLYEIFGDNFLSESQLQPWLKIFASQELKIFPTMFSKKLNTSVTSSMGRLFDGVAALVNLCHKATFEGQAAMQLEFALDGIKTDDYYHFELLTKTEIIEIDWQPIILNILEDIQKNISVGIISAKFHNSLIEIIIAIAHKIKIDKIVLSGGCWQNKYLCDRTIQALNQEGFQPYWHQLVPPNDGGISLGQIVAAAMEIKQTRNNK